MVFTNRENPRNKIEVVLRATVTQSIWYDLFFTPGPCLSRVRMLQAVREGLFSGFSRVLPLTS